MPDQRTSENWRLEEGGNEDDKWLLEESEQQLSDQWQLQEPPLEPINSWQPVEYVKAPRPAGTWILPTIITVALLVTLGYAGYRVLPPLLSGDREPTATVDESVGVPGQETSQPVAEATEPAELSTPAEESAAPPVQEAATPTLPPPTPTETTLISQDFATVNSPFGVNARFAPNVDAAIIRILENGETLFVFGQQGEWLEVFVADTPLTEGQPLSGTVGFAATEFFTLAPQDITAGLRDQILEYTGKLPTPTPEPTAAAVEDSTIVTGTEAVPPGTSVTDTTSTAPAAPLLTVTINAVNGVNVRRLPQTDDTNIIRLLENGTVLPATGRTADSQWIQVTLPDAVSGWIAAEFLVPSADIATLPVVDGSEAPSVTAPGGPVTPTTVITSGVAPTAPYTSVIPDDSTPAIIVTVADGVNARTTPDLEGEVETVVPEGAVLPATGRSADGLWVQVQLPTGTLAWIFRDTVNATPAVGALPAVGGPTPEPILLPTPTPNPGTAAPEEPAAEPTAAESETDAPEATTVTAEVIPFFLPVYAEPDAQAEAVARSPRGTDFVVIGQTEDGSWLQVTTPAGETGWVIAGNVRVTGDVTGVPVVE